MTYPQLAGHQDIEGTVARDNARASDESGRTKTGLDLTLADLKRHGPCTSDQIAARIGLAYPIVRARMVQLAEMGLAHSTMTRARGANGGTSTVWAATPEHEVATMMERRKAARLDREKRRFAKLLAELGIPLEGASIHA